MSQPQRRSARVLCLDPDDRVLMLRWRDPVDGHLLWEPPGGGLEPGETPRQAARRELAEETGLRPAVWAPESTDVTVDVRWKGRRLTVTEPYFLARVDVADPPISRDGLVDYEVTSLIEHRWVPWNAVTALPDTYSPPDIPAILSLLDQAGPWAVQQNRASDR